MPTMDDLDLIGRTLVIFGVTLVALAMVLPEQIASAMKERTGLFGLVVAGFAAVWVGFVIATFGG